MGRYRVLPSSWAEIDRRSPPAVQLGIQPERWTYSNAGRMAAGES